MNASRVIVISGGTRGIGAAIARRCAADGDRLILGYRSRRAEAEELARELRSKGAEVELCAGDLTVPGSEVALIEAARERFGRLDALVNNAGSTLHLGELARTPEDIIRTVIDTNLTATVLLARAAVLAFERQEGPGVIVNISSTAAQTGAPGSYVHYAAAKAGVEALTVGLAAEVAGRGIRVVGVAPGTTFTDLHAEAGAPGRAEAAAARIPFGRAGHPEEVAAAVHWLLGEDAGYTGGTIIRVAGAA